MGSTPFIIKAHLIDPPQEAIELEKTRRPPPEGDHQTTTRRRPPVDQHQEVTTPRAQHLRLSISGAGGVGVVVGEQQPREQHWPPTAGLNYRET